MADDIEMCGADASTAQLVVGRLGMPGAPIVKLDLRFAADRVNGAAEINQAVIGGRHRFEVSGEVAPTGDAPFGLRIALQGEFPHAGQSARFGAVLTVDQAWVGEGQFEYLQTKVSKAPVKPEA
ncbi:hypothetical protein CFHF_08180 [Caulobacter flavus]|uniref:DUF1842 domain-containing protein n=1 Tax=Caulobacter flavus TaxID=1679497 RepID=A0A2N5CVF6_9CAUL|nr:DUF1842 domain-containing protein [Caulobacter flavus]AYV46884.1 hypothetical protein C1707_11765 [Caulobacter flavus]PLR17792.1 hypothetical protein CFHF_08180 [Caulobacter flavus]